jgi:hypothetical protein
MYMIIGSVLGHDDKFIGLYDTLEHANDDLDYFKSTHGKAWSWRITTMRGPATIR